MKNIILSFLYLTLAAASAQAMLLDDQRPSHNIEDRRPDAVLPVIQSQCRACTISKQLTFHNVVGGAITDSGLVYIPENYYLTKEIPQRHQQDGAFVTDPDRQVTLAADLTLLTGVGPRVDTLYIRLSKLRTELIYTATNGRELNNSSLFYRTESEREDLAHQICGQISPSAIATYSSGRNNLNGNHKTLDAVDCRLSLND